MTVDEVDFKMQEMAKRASAPFDIAVEAAREAEKATRATGGAVEQLSDEYQNLQSAVQSALSGALDVGVGVSADSLLESMGLRPDALNEDARRLADVAVKGWDSPWADYFRTTFPQMFDDMYFGGDIKAVAAQQLKDFEDGLNPELIDHEQRQGTHQENACWRRQYGAVGSGTRGGTFKRAGNSHATGTVGSPRHFRGWRGSGNGLC